jgi:hypothetical protein
MSKISTTLLSYSNSVDYLIISILPIEYSLSKIFLKEMYFDK